MGHFGLIPYATPSFSSLGRIALSEASLLLRYPPTRLIDCRAATCGAPNDASQTHSGREYIAITCSDPKRLSFGLPRWQAAIKHG